MLPFTPAYGGLLTDHLFYQGIHKITGAGHKAERQILKSPKICQARPWCPKIVNTRVYSKQDEPLCIAHAHCLWLGNLHSKGQSPFAFKQGGQIQLPTPYNGSWTPLSLSHTWALPIPNWHRFKLEYWYSWSKDISAPDESNL